jgi:hypothetical protein
MPNVSAPMTQVNSTIRVDCWNLIVHVMDANYRKVTPIQSDHYSFQRCVHADFAR